MLPDVRSEGESGRSRDCLVSAVLLPALGLVWECLGSNPWLSSRKEDLVREVLERSSTLRVDRLLTKGGR